MAFKGFHIVQQNIQEKAAQRLHEINTNAEHKALRPMAARLVEHYSAAASPNEPIRYDYLQAALCFLVSKKPMEGVRMAAADRNISIEAMQTIMATAINAGPKEWLDDEKGFYQKGMKRVRSLNDRYFAISELLGVVGDADFEKARGQVAEKFQPIVDMALDFAVAKKRMANPMPMGKRLLSYITAQLMPEGSEKEFRMNAISQRMSQNDHADHLSKSHDVIMDIAKRLGIIVPAEMLTNSVPTSERKASIQKVGLGAKHAASAVSAPVAKPTLPSLPGRPTEEALERDRLRDLRRLLETGRITERQGYIYVFMNNPRHNRTERDAAEKFHCSLEAVYDSRARVSRELDKLDKQAEPVPKAKP